MSKPKLTKENIATIQDALVRYACHQLDLIKCIGSDLAKRNYNNSIYAFNAIGEFDGGKQIKWGDKFKKDGEKE